jgi:hypothetical protein
MSVGIGIIKDIRNQIKVTKLSNCFERIKNICMTRSNEPFFVNIENAEQKAEVYDFCNVRGIRLLTSSLLRRRTASKCVALIDKSRSLKQHLL